MSKFDSKVSTRPKMHVIIQVWACLSQHAHISGKIWCTYCHHLHALWCGLEMHTAHSDYCCWPLWCFRLQAQIDRNLNSPISQTTSMYLCWVLRGFEIQTIQEGDILLHSQVLESSNEYQTKSCTCWLSTAKNWLNSTSPFSSWEGGIWAQN